MSGHDAAATRSHLREVALAFPKPDKQNDRPVVVMADLNLPDFPDALIERIDRYIQVLEELNPGFRWSRSACVATLLARSLAEIEGAEIRWSRREGADRRATPRGSERRKLAYPDFVDLVIEQLLNRQGGPDDETWRTKHED